MPQLSCGTHSVAAKQLRDPHGCFTPSLPILTPAKSGPFVQYITPAASKQDKLAPRKLKHLCLVAYFQSLTHLSWLAEATMPVADDWASAAIKPSWAGTVMLCFSTIFHSSKDCTQTRLSQHLSHSSNQFVQVTSITVISLHMGVKVWYQS